MNLKNNLLSYENRMIMIFFLVLGFVALDQLTLSYLTPVISNDLHLNNAQIGQISMWQSIGFAILAPFTGYLSDKMGKRKPFIIFALSGIVLFSALTILTTTFKYLLIIRLLAGMCEGAIMPIMLIMVQASSTEGRFGRNVGFVVAGAAVIASTIGPVLMTHFAVVIGWRMCYLFVCIPNLITLLLVKKLITEKIPIQAEEKAETETQKGRYIQLLKYRNFLLCIVIAMLYLTGEWTICTFGPLYLTNIGRLSIEQMGLIMTLYGLIAIFWQVFIPAISDSIGRKLTIISSIFLAALVPTVMYIYPVGWLSQVVLALFGGNCIVLPCMLTGVIVIESVPSNLTASASSFITSIGQLFSAFMVGISGMLADLYGLGIVMVISSVAFICAAIVGFALIETNPLKVNQYVLKEM